MIDFRYHLVSLVSVFLALAVGIVLGAGPLKGTIGDTLNSQVASLRAEAADLRTQVKTAQGAVNNRDDFARQVTPSLVAAQLGGESVVLVTLPGADTDALKPLTQVLATAGARVTGRIDVKDAWVDPGRAADRDAALRTLTAAATATAPPPGSASSSASSSTSSSIRPATTATADSPGVPGSSATVAGLAGVLGRAVLTTELGGGDRLDASRTALLDGLRKAGLVSVDGGSLAGAATEAVVLVPPVVTSGTEPSPTPSAGADPLPQWATLAATLDARSVGTVVVGPASSATAGGVIATIRDVQGLGARLSTVDTGSTPMGDVTTVLALREQAQGGSGSYGFVGRVDAPLPSLTGSGSAS